MYLNRVVIISLLLVLAFQESSAQFAGGSGTSDDPYQISTATQLDSVRNYLSSHFIQIADIDLSTSGTWVPLGSTTSSSFTGSYDGNNFEISNLSLGNGNYVGLFREIGTGGVVKQLKITSATVTNSTRNGNRIGVLAGQISGGSVSRCSITGTLTINGYHSDYIGGLIGYANASATISKSSFSGSIQVNASQLGNVGGLIGFIQNVSVDNSYVILSANLNPAGLNEVGGMIGYTVGSTISNSFCVSNALSGYEHINAVVGRSLGTSFSNVYFDSTSSGMPDSFGTMGRTTAQMQQQSTYSGWDFTSIWAIEEGSGYPFLQDGSTNLLTITGDEGWRLLASPIDGASFETLLDTLWLQGFTGADTESGSPNLYYWDEATQSFSAPSSVSDIPDNGEGFLVYVYSDHDNDNTDDGFPKVLQPEGDQYTGTVTKNLSYTETGESSSSGWNLVGNPYGTSIHWDGEGWGKTNIDNVIYVWSDSAGAYLTWNGLTGTLSDGKIAGWQGYWVKANDESPSLVVSDSARHAGATHYKRKATPQVKMQLKAEDGLSSEAIVVFDNRASFAKDTYDAYKLQPLDPEYLTLATMVRNGEPMDIQALPFDFDTTGIMLEINGTNLEGSFQLDWDLTSLPDEWTIELIDLESEQVIDLKESQSYIFSFATDSSAGKIKSKTKSLSTPRIPIGVQAMSKLNAEASRFSLNISQSVANNAEPEPEFPEAFGLAQNYPNPFNPATTISYQLPVRSQVDLRVFDLLGREVATLVKGQVEAGYHQVPFNGSHLASGMYIYRLQTGNQIFTKKLTLIK